MAGLHVIHLRRQEWSGGPWPSLSDPRHRTGTDTTGRAGTGREGEEVRLLTISQVLSGLFPLNPEADCPSLLRCLNGPSHLVQPQLTSQPPPHLLPPSLLPLHHSIWSGTQAGNRLDSLSTSLPTASVLATPAGSALKNFDSFPLLAAAALGPGHQHLPPGPRWHGPLLVSVLLWPHPVRSGGWQPGHFLLWGAVPYPAG